MKMSQILVGAALWALVLVTSAPAEAQTPAQPDPVRLKIAHEILAANGGAHATEERMRAMFASMTTLVADGFSNADPKAAKTAQAVMNYMAEEEIKAIPQLIEQAAIIYANNLSEAELRDLLTWSVSPSAQAINAKATLMSQQLMVAQGPLMKKMIAGAVTTAVDRACAEAKCTDDERKTITAIAQKSVPAS